MSQARATILRTIKSFNYRYMICSSRSDSSSFYSFDSVKSLSFVKNFSTLNSAATDESFDCQNPSEFSPNNGQIANGYRENPMTVQRNPSEVYGQRGNFQDNRGTFTSDFQQYQNGNSGIFNGYNGNRTMQQVSNGSFGEIRNVQSSYRLNSASGEVLGGVNGQYLNSNGVAQQNQGNYNMGSHGSFSQSSYGTNSGSTRSPEKAPVDGYGAHIATYQHQTNRFNEESNQQSFSGFYSNNSSGIYNQTPNQSYSYSQPVEESVKDVDEGQLRGTIEELDHFCKERKLNEALEVLALLEQHGIAVDIPQYLVLMKECGQSQALKEAKYVHEHLIRSASHIDVWIYNKILEMYSECGSMDDAYKVFDKMPLRNMTSWDTMITGLAKNGHGEDAIDMFSEFKKIGLKPDSQMFLGVFAACSVIGDMKEGLLHFESMIKDYNIVPSMELYSSVVGMLGSAGYLYEAMEFIEKMPMEPNVEIWEIMMNQGRIHGDIELGDRCAELVEMLDPSRLDEQSKAGLIPAKASDIAKEKEKKRLSSFNPLEVKTKVYEYRAGDTSHPDHEKLYTLLRCLKNPMKEVGYVPETKFVLHDIDQESKEEALLSHSERLALAQALMTSPARSPMRIIKNLRVCGDCHNALKIISKLVGRLIVARDAKRFHHFENGVCSCGDYW